MIGAGLAGLSAACYLTGHGYAVTVVERNDVPGGRAGVLRRDGFTFDTGPTVFTMPNLLTDAIRAATGDPTAALSELLTMRSENGDMRKLANLQRRLALACPLTGN